ncbi:MAG: hypothetical protein IE933_13540 [Sphingomonadales bacterium]|nr:hypothetical protein [Sphingomonadales bacterium]MBD3773775.1 hypothetical protein [Paracoccaceae bacterium]
MIESRTEPSPASFVERLAAKARALAEARGATLIAERRRDPARWRNARLLWPFF